jgi:sulfhydrogenase subunit beta (sulfur reductase)
VGYDVPLNTTKAYFLDRETFQSLLDAHISRGFQCIGPRVRKGSIVYEPLSEVGDFPAGISIDQQPGHYSTRANGSSRWFAWSNGPQALKPLLFAPVVPMWTVARSDKGHLQFTQANRDPPKLSVLGIRACDLAALRLHDQHYISLFTQLIS